MALDRVSTSGAALAALLTSLATSPSDVDGFILGSVRSRTRITLQDNAEAATSQAHDANITALPCLASSFSFYEPSGAVDGDRLRELTAAFEEPVLGWFTYRADTSLAPSMREQVLAAAVLQALRQQQGVGEAACMSLLFANMSSSRQHGGASTSFHYRFFQNGGPQQGLQPVRLTVCNIGSAHGHHRDFALPAPLGALPAVPFVIDPSPAADGGRGDSATGGAAPTEGGASVAAAGGGGSGGGGGKWAAAGAAAGGAAVSGADSDALPDMARQAVAGVQVQVDSIERLYFQLLREVEQLEPLAAADCAELQERRAAVCALYDSLAL